nr:WEB family protein At1g12150-like [Ipomoea batatas]
MTKEKLKSEKLERTVAELKETNLQLRAAVREAAVNREAEMQNLEKELAEKDALVERLKLELGQTKELNLSSEKIASETIAGLNHKTGKMKAELRRNEKPSRQDPGIREERCKREIFALNRALQLTAASQQASSSINNVTIFRKEYEALSNKADEQVTMMEEKLGKLERDLMTTTHKIREMRTRAEQAISRAEAAEKAKAELEVKIKRRKENEKEKKEFFKNLRDQINSSREAAATLDIVPGTNPCTFSCGRKARGTRILIMNSELENGSVENLRMQIKDAGGHRSEIGDRLSRMATEIMAAQGEILGLEAQLAGAEAVKTALTKEKLKSEKLERTVAELKETNLQLREAAANREAEMQNLEKELAEKDALVEKLKLKLGQTKELNLSSEKIASETIADLNRKTEKMKAELDEIRSQADRILESEVENALLKVELHKWRSKAAAAEAAVERCKREIFALNRALQLTAASQQASSSINNITISRNEYEALSNKADEQVTMMEEKLGKLERELITATHKIREMRTRAEQAISRAEAAEKAKAELEVKIKRRKEKEKEKKEFFKNLRDQINSSKEAAATPDFAPINTPAIQTLSNVLEIPL